MFTIKMYLNPQISFQSWIFLYTWTWGCNNLFEGETIKRYDYLPCIDNFLFLLEVISIWQGNYVCLNTFRNFERLINFTTRHLWVQRHSCFHEFMNSWIIKVHENQVMQYESMLSCLCTAIVKVNENQVNQFEVYCIYQDTWKLAEDI